MRADVAMPAFSWPPLSRVLLMLVCVYQVSPAFVPRQSSLLSTNSSTSLSEPLSSSLPLPSMLPLSSPLPSSAAATKSPLSLTPPPPSYSSSPPSLQLPTPVLRPVPFAGIDASTAQPDTRPPPSHPANVGATVTSCPPSSFPSQLPPGRSHEPSAPPPLTNADVGRLFLLILGVCSCIAMSFWCMWWCFRRRTKEAGMLESQILKAVASSYAGAASSGGSNGDAASQPESKKDKRDE
jgi:hypothetical protein